MDDINALMRQKLQQEAEGSELRQGMHTFFHGKFLMVAGSILGIIVVVYYGYKILGTGEGGGATGGFNVYIGALLAGGILFATSKLEDKKHQIYASAAATLIFLAGIHASFGTGLNKRVTTYERGFNQGDWRESDTTPSKRVVRKPTLAERQAAFVPEVVEYIERYVGISPSDKGEVVYNSNTRFGECFVKDDATFEPAEMWISGKGWVPYMNNVATSKLRPIGNGKAPRIARAERWKKCPPTL